MTDLLSASALDLAALVRSRSVSSVELTRFFLDRIARHDGALSSFVSVIAEAALGSARRKDARTSRGDLPAFHGVPIGIKDANFVRGTFTRMGSRAFRWLWSPVDDVTAAALRRGGFVILGKLATSEFGAMPVTEPDIHPPTRNPWALDRTPGGSSGGSGAAVAAGLLPIAQGSDGAGSIRIPSAFCHLYGFKCSRGRLPEPHAATDVFRLTSCGPLAHTVDDAAAMMAVMGDQPPPRPASRVGPRLRIRVATRSPLGPTEPEIEAATLRVARLLESLGHHVEDAPFADGSLDEFMPLWQRLEANIPVLGESLLQPVTRWLREGGRRHAIEDVAARHRALEARVLAGFGDVDLWVTPAVPVLPPKIGAWRDLPPEEAFRQAAQLGPFTAPFNLSGQPAASVPAGVSREGLPIGVQIVGRRDADETVLAVSRELEAAMPWRGRRAPMAATGSC